MLPRLYAELLLKLSRSAMSDAKAVDHFLDVLKARGHEALLPRIVREFERVLAREGRREGVALRVAKKGDGKSHAKEAKAVLSKLGIEVEPQEVVDEFVVSGFSLEGANFRYDASARKSLITMFEALSA